MGFSSRGVSFPHPGNAHAFAANVPPRTGGIRADKCPYCGKPQKLWKSPAHADECAEDARRMNEMMAAYGGRHNHGARLKVWRHGRAAEAEE